MHIAVHLDRARLFRWHLALLKDLQARKHHVSVRFRDVSEPLPTSLTAMLDLDHVRAHAGPERFSTRLSPRAFDEYAGTSEAPAGLAIDLSVASRVMRIEGRVLRAFYDGEPKDYGLFHALLEQRAPNLSLFDTKALRAWNIGLPGLTTPSNIAVSLDQVSSRLIQGIGIVLSRIEAGEQAPALHESSPPDTSNQSILQAAGVFAALQARRTAALVGEKITGNAPRWHVAWRKSSHDIPPAGSRNFAEFRILADDGRRTYSEPCMLVQSGQCHVFVRECPEAGGVRSIAHFTLSHEGEASRPRTVLAVHHDLEGPFVFQHDGTSWMLTASFAAGGVELYRAEHFPAEWTFEARLIEGLVSNPVLFEHNGLFWIAAGEQTLQSSDRDALALYYSQSLKGPWLPHRRNPVVLDARSAVPGGRPWENQERLIRPGQDWTSQDGCQLSLRAITVLTPSDFAEDVVGTIQFGSGKHLPGPHRLAFGGGFEVVDTFAKPGALRAGYQSPTTL